MSTAKAITAALASKGIERTAPGAIYCVLMDGPRSVCMTEAMLDTWFLNLSPEQKAEICEHHHDGTAEINPAHHVHIGGTVPNPPGCMEIGYRQSEPLPVPLKGASPSSCNARRCETPPSSASLLTSRSRLLPATNRKP